MNRNEPINSTSLIISMITLIVGFILVLYGNSKVYDIIGYVVSGILMTTALIRFFIAYRTSKRTNDLEIGAILFSVILFCLGVFVAFKPGLVMTLLSICIGALITFFCVQRLILGLTVKKIDEQGSKFFVIESILMIVLGVVILSQQLLSLLGLFLIAYSIFELSGYIYYKSQNKDYSEVLNKKVTKEMRESEAKDAIIDEEEKDEQ